MVNSLRLDLGAADLAHMFLDPICTVYDEVFSAPPFFWRDDESELHRERLLGLLQDSSFGIAVAQTEVGQLVGFAYGFALAPDTQRWSRMAESLAEEVTAEWPGRTFMFFDYAVRASHRGQGIGHRLHDLLLGSRSEERATLTVQPTAMATKALYERWGWYHVGQSIGGPQAAAPMFDVYLRDSLDDLKPAHTRP